MTRPPRLNTRKQFLSWLTREMACLNRRSISRALEDPSTITELLGGFSAIPPSGSPGWIVRVTSRNRSVWNIAVLAHKDRYGIRLVKSVPWENWTGGKTQVCEGDNPTRYTYLKGFKERLNGRKANQ